ncbi:esterase [Erwinia sp. OLTSP20]|uniref:esterase n=1 Tax=unclassified Erwinia TaxID=2622719 RepID=UPI000C194422|nr:MULTISPECIES: esterase [unclassified Erwinia]PIJ52061.1 esterase [Erwinia sp. OAMSP11]PIJ75224.1 esterase [Erwinia sp. OLSSP12]PIJ84431.1 esterase [Erwinia sp. OLCASP19]PIJ87045.1 esterase [Erwinia sp. OLMTSP26]PIJ88609.1 esterase [Erwinia sp. OLMDSP33]
MIEVNVETLAGIECLHATPAGQQHTPLPTVLFWHGFTSSKEVYAYFAVALAQKGFRALLPDAQMHGARYNGDSAMRLGHFWSILQNNIDEVPLLIAALEQRQLIAQGRIAIGGASQGAMTALAAMARYPALRCGASLMGSGYFMSLCHQLFPPLVVDSAQQQQRFEQIMAPLAEYEISHQLDKLSDRPLLLWHGDADDVVPIAESERLVQAMREAGADRHLTWLPESGVGHRITPAALAAFSRFFTHHL